MTTSTRGSLLLFHPSTSPQMEINKGMNHYNNYKYNLHKNYTISLCTCVKNENAMGTTITGIAALSSNHSSNVGFTYPYLSDGLCPTG